MSRDPLAVLRRLRDAAVTEACRDLATARAHEMQEAQRLDEHRSQIRRELSEAGAEHVAAFSAWLPYARQRTDHLQTSLQSEQARVLRLQQILVGRRTEAEAVAKAMERQQAEAALTQARREQSVMDEAAGRRTGREGTG
ncbi:MAG: flagellar export protein FliJ [Acetobacteraceae bacterium]|nr:flagellar export protein FliJ [Acetobacteraceae bacterium]